MEELYALLRERLTSVQDFVQKFDLLISQFEGDPAFCLLPLQLSELSHFINNLKKAEKIRVLRENDFLDTIFTLPSFDCSQLIRFQEKSYEIMQKIAPEFSYEKYEPTGDLTEAFRLYYRLFQFLEMHDRIEDLRRVYSNIKLANFPTVAMLIKWLTEIARKYYHDYLKEKSLQLSSQMSKPTQSVKESVGTVELSQKMLRPTTVSLSVEPKGNNADTSPEKESSAMNFQAKIREFNEDISRKQLQNFLNAPTANTNVALRQILSQLVSRADKPKLRKAEEAAVSTNKGDITPSPPKKHRFSFAMQKIPDSTPIAETYPRYLAITTPEQQQANYLDIIEDLDCSVAGSMLAYHTRKPQGTKILDFERKKEFTVHYYRSICLRNTEIERSINSYKLKLKEKKRIDYDPNQLLLKGELYTEKITLASLVKHFSFAITEETKLKYPAIFPGEEKAKSCCLDDKPQSKFRVTTNSIYSGYRSVTPNRASVKCQTEKKLTQATVKEVDISFQPPKERLASAKNKRGSFRETKQRLREVSLKQSIEDSFETSIRIQNTEPSYRGLDLYRFDASETRDLTEISTNSYQPTQKKAIAPVSDMKIINNENANPIERAITQPDNTIAHPAVIKKIKASYLIPVKSTSPKKGKCLPLFQGADRLGHSNPDFAGLRSNKNGEATLLLSSLFYNVPETRGSKPIDLPRQKEYPSIEIAEPSRDISPKKRNSFIVQKNKSTSETPKNASFPTKPTPPATKRRSMTKEKQQSPAKKANVVTASSLASV